MDCDAADEACTRDGSFCGGNDDRSVDDTNWYGDASVDVRTVTQLLRTGSGSSFLNLPICHKARISKVNMMTKKKDSAYTNVKQMDFRIS